MADLGTRNGVASALKRLKASKTIRQLARGLYDYPARDPVLGIITPSADAIARALVVRNAIRLQPSGAYAANQLGLSEQVPSRVVFLTDGPARKVKIGKREIILQHTTPRNMVTAGRKSGSLIQALRYLGKDQVDDRVIATLRRRIDDKDHPGLRKDLIHAPGGSPISYARSPSRRLPHELFPTASSRTPPPRIPASGRGHGFASFQGTSG